MGRQGWPGACGADLSGYLREVLGTGGPGDGAGRGEFSEPRGEKRRICQDIGQVGAPGTYAEP